jgi:hypothetical protein
MSTARLTTAIALCIVGCRGRSDRERSIALHPAESNTAQESGNSDASNVSFDGRFFVPVLVAK